MLTADRTGLQDSERVETVQSTLVAALKTHCVGRYGRNASVMVGRLLGLLVELRSVGRLMADLLSSRIQSATETTELAVLTRIVSAIGEHITA